MIRLQSNRDPEALMSDVRSKSPVSLASATLEWLSAIVKG